MYFLKLQLFKITQISVSTWCFFKGGSKTGCATPFFSGDGGGDLKIYFH